MGMLVRAYPGLDSSRDCKKKKIAKQRKPKEKKNDYKGQHTYSHGPCVHWTALRTKAFRPALSFVQHKPRSTLTAEGYLFRLQDGVKARQLTILYHYLSPFAYVRYVQSTKPLVHKTNWQLLA